MKKHEDSQVDDGQSLGRRLFGISGVLVVHALALLIVTSYLIRCVLEVYAFSDEQDVLIPTTTLLTFDYAIKTAKWWYVFVPAVLLCDFLVLFGLTSNLFKGRRLYHCYSMLFLLFTMCTFFVFSFGSSLAVKSFRETEDWDALAGRQKAERLLFEGRYQLYQTEEEQLGNPPFINQQLFEYKIHLTSHWAIVDEHPTYVAAFNARMRQAIEKKYGKGFIEKQKEIARNRDQGS